jgi:hypothetical protein
MAFVLETMGLVLGWLRGELLIAAALALLVVGPGAACCWVGARVSGVRLAGRARLRWFRPAPAGLDRVEHRLESLSTALSLLTDSTETGLREAITNLERLSGGPAAPPRPVAAERPADPQRVQVAARQGQSPRDIAIAEGVSEGEVRLRMRLQQLAS